MSELVCVYRYSSWIGDFNVNIIFLNHEKYQREGADHSYASLCRQKWAESLLMHYRNLLATNTEKVHCLKITRKIILVLKSWNAFPDDDHEYLRYLRNNGYQYDEYQVTGPPENICQANIFIRPPLSAISE